MEIPCDPVAVPITPPCFALPLLSLQRRSLYALVAKATGKLEKSFGSILDPQTQNRLPLLVKVFFCVTIFIPIGQHGMDADAEHSTATKADYGQADNLRGWQRGHNVR